MEAGHIVILNGTSSSGKTTLAHRIHELADEVWVVLGQDEFTSSLLPNYVATGEVGEGEGYEGFFFARAPDGLLPASLSAHQAATLRKHGSVVLREDAHQV